MGRAVNERQVKEEARGPKAICSLSGRACKCALGKGCGRGVVDPLASEALLAARTAHAHIQGGVDELAHAVERLSRRRAYPAPEWRDIGRQLETLLEQLRNTL